MHLGDIKFFKPHDRRLQSLIKGYCIHSSDDPDFDLKIRFYQNTTNTISIYKDSVTSGCGKNRVQTHQPNSGLNTQLVGLIDGYQEVHFVGKLQRVAIIFYAGGLNHFLSQPLNHYIRPNFTKFSYFDEQFRAFLPLLFNLKEVEKKRNLLDQFLLNNLIDFDQPKLLQAIDIINDDNSIKVACLAKHLSLHRRTLLRLFKRHLGLPIEAYKQSCRFRNALMKYKDSQKNADLASIAHESHYYDQASFSHQLKSTTELTPKELFSKLKIIDETLFWLH